MNKDVLGERLLKGLIITFLLLTVYAVIGGIIQAAAGLKCLSHGYTDVRIAYNFDSYCVLQVNATNIIIPLDSLERTP